MAAPGSHGPHEQIAGRAVLTYARGWQSLAATRSLGRHGIEVVTGDEYALTPASFSRYSLANFRYPNPDAEPDAFLDRLEEVVREHRPASPQTPYVLMPIHKETYLLSRHRARFEPLIRLPVPDIDHIEQVHDKGDLAAYAMDRGISTPRTWLPKSLDELRTTAAKIPLPAFVKLRASAAGVGIQKVDTAAELVSTFTGFLARYPVEDDALPLVQEAVPGDDYCVTTLFDRGQLRAAMTYHNLRAYPADKGASVLRETVAAPEMERIAGELLGGLGWHGVAELDFRWDGRSEPKLIEVNPRFWGGLIQAVESGWDYPWLLFRLAVDGHVAAPEATRTDVRTETPVLGFLATLEELADDEQRMAKLKQAFRDARADVKGGGSKRAAVRKLLGGLDDYADVKRRFGEVKRLLKEHEGNVYDVLSARDPLPALGILYPLAVFLKHGKLSMELITSEGGPAAGEER